MNLFKYFFGDKPADRELKIVSKGNKVYIISGGEKYNISNDDIPGIIEAGPGKLIAKSGKNSQSMNSSFKGLNCLQVNSKLFVNGVDIGELLLRLQEKK